MLSALRAALRLALLLALVALLFPLSLATRLADLAGARGPAARAAARVQSWWARASLAILGVELELHGKPPARAGLVCANHQGYIDVFVLGALVPGRFVAMHEIAGWPLLGWMARSTGTLFLNRDRKRDVLEVGPRMDATLERGVRVLLFPEGRAGAGDGWRRSRRRSSRAPPGPGCLACRWGSPTARPASPFSPAWTVCWWGGMGLWRHLWRLLRLSRVKAEVRFGAVELRCGRAQAAGGAGAAPSSSG